MSIMDRPYKKLEELIIKEHNLTKCRVIDTRIGRLDVIVEPDINEEKQFLVDDTVDKYFGEDWCGFSITYNTSEYKS